MRTDSKRRALEAIKRLEGLTRKLRTMVEEDAYCPRILELALAMQGHLKHIQAHVLENHLHTCAVEKLPSAKNRSAFVAELLNVIGLSRR